MLFPDTLEGYISFSDTKEERAEILAFLVKREGITEDKPGKLANLFLLIPGLVDRLKTNSGMRSDRWLLDAVGDVMLRREHNWMMKDEKDIVAYLDLIVKSPYFGESAVTTKPVKKMIGDLETLIEHLNRR